VLGLLRRLAVAEEARDLPDRELLLRFLSRRDERAFEALVQRHGPLVLGVCRRALANEHDAEDVFQAAFLALSRQAPSLRRLESVGSWLHGVAWRLALKTRAAAGRRARVARAQPAGGRDPLDEMTVREAQATLDEELARLPEKYRAPLLLCYLGGLTREEAARQLGWPAGTLKSRLEQARERLRRRLRLRGLSLPAALLASALAGAAAAAVPGTLLRSVVKSAITTSAQGGAKVMSTTGLGIVAGVVLAVATVCVGARLRPERPEADGPPAAKPDRPKKLAPAPRALKVSDRPRAIAWGPGGVLAGVTHELGEGAPPAVRKSAVRLWDVRTGALKRVLAEDELKQFWWQHVAFSPDGKTVAAASDGNGGDEASVGVVVLWDARTGKRKHALKHTLLIRWVAFSPDGRTLATATGGNVGRDFPTVQLWDAQTGKLLRSLETTDKMAVRVAFAPDGKAVAAVLQVGEGVAATAEVVVWDTAGKELFQAPAGPAVGQGIAFSADGKRLLIATRDRLAEWDVRTGEAGRAASLMTGFDEGSWSAIAFSPDGKTLAVAGKQRGRDVVTLWDVPSAKLLATWKGHEGHVWSLAFAPDGHALASGGGDGTIRFWPLPRGARPKK
jgi:RNA polymerase sigma factor (sigma-70 family)